LAGSSFTAFMEHFAFDLEESFVVVASFSPLPFAAEEGLA